MQTLPAATLLLAFASILVSLDPCSAALYERVADLPSIDYDFVVVGGGGAGNVIANRLTENPSFEVLVLEAGPSNEGALDSIVPLFASRLGNTLYDWNYTTTVQPGLNGRSIGYPRGHILGGSTSINGMVYTRGSSDDFDRYANITGDPGWSWDSLQPYIRKNEKWTEPADHHNTVGQFNPAVHGFHGINSVSLAGFPHAIDRRVITASTELSDEFPFNLDMNSGSPLGLGWMQATVNGGRRSSSATSYLGPQFIGRPNLHVLVNTQVTRVLPTARGRSKLDLRTVEFTQSVGDPRKLITASKEVVLSGGAIGTPHILLNSGIGDEDELTAVGIKPVFHLPDVGKNLSDQPLLPNSWFVNSTKTYETILRNATLLAELLEFWNRTQKGPLVTTAPSHIAWLRLPDNSTIFDTTPDPAAGPHTPHFELVVTNGIAFFTPPTGNYIGVNTAVVTPTTRGSVKLNTSNPFDAPLIDPGLLGSEFDIFTMREAVKSARRFLAAPAWDGYVLEPLGDLANATTDALLDQYIRNNAFTGAHPVGTASMSREDAAYGVVNPDLRVKGVSGLRIVDASILPIVTSAHIQAAVYMIAERAADLIKDMWQ